MKNFKLSEKRYTEIVDFSTFSHPSIHPSIAHFFHLCARRHKTLFFLFHASLFYGCCCCCYLLPFLKVQMISVYKLRLTVKVSHHTQQKSERANERTYTNSKFEWWILQLNVNLNRFIGIQSHTTQLILYFSVIWWGKIHWQDKIQLVFQLTVKIYILLLGVVCARGTCSAR